jgi:hypothetical protein
MVEKLRRFLACLGLLFVLLWVFAGELHVTSVGAWTPVEDHITRDTTWTILGSPYRVIGDVIVDPGATLTIEPGVRVEFSDGSSLIVSGTLYAVGTTGAMINFTSSRYDPYPGAWKTIRFIGGEDESFAIVFCQVLYAEHGTTVQSLGQVRIEGSAFKNCLESGLHTIGQNNLIIINNTFTSLKYGIFGEGEKFSSITVQNNIINSARAGIYIYANSDYDIHVYNITIQNNQISSQSAICIYTCYACAHDAQDTYAYIYDITIQNNLISSGAVGIYMYTYAYYGTPYAYIYDVTIQNNQILSEGDGMYIYTYYIYHAYIYDVTIQNNQVSLKRNGVYVYASLYGSGASTYIHDVIIQNNQISSGENGIYIYTYTYYAYIYDVIIQNNQISSKGNGVYVYADIYYGYANIYNIIIQNNQISSKEENGIYIYAYAYGAFASIYNATIQNNQAFSCRSAGLRAEAIPYQQKFAYDVVIMNNTFSANEVGILINGVRTNITLNSISYNFYGIKYIGTTGNLAHFNDIYRSSLFGMYVSDGATVNAEYNYWGNETGPHHESANPEGTGDSVNGLGADLDFIPWLTSPIRTITERPDFSITASPTSLAIQQSSSDRSIITITSINSFNHLVQLTVSGAPLGVTAALSPEQVTPSPNGSIASTLTVSVAKTAALGTYTLTVTGNSGTLTHIVGVSLKIMTVPPPVPDYPLAEWIESPNYTPTEQRNITYIIIHVMEGYFEGTIDWFKTNTSNVSAHYLISQKGEIVQMVREKDIAWHAGNWEYNQRSIGIEHEDKRKWNEPNWATEELYRSSAALVRYLCEKYGIPKDRNHIIGHNEVPGVTKPCPGPYWDWDYFMGSIKDVPTQRKFWAVWENIDYPVLISSNSTVSNFAFNQSQAQISFNLTGPSGTRAFCNVTIPKSLLKDHPWELKIDGINLGFTLSENATHSFLYFTYTYASTLQVTIRAAWVIPEFPPSIILPLFVLVTLIATILLKKKRKLKSQQPFS